MPFSKLAGKVEMSHPMNVFFFSLLKLEFSFVLFLWTELLWHRRRRRFESFHHFVAHRWRFFSFFFRGVFRGEGRAIEEEDFWRDSSLSARRKWNNKKLLSLYKFEINQIGTKKKKKKVKLAGVSWRSIVSMCVCVFFRDACPSPVYDTGVMKWIGQRMREDLLPVSLTTQLLLS